jgi:hypothetical protein
MTDAGITTTVLARTLGICFEGYVNNGGLPGLWNVIGTGTVAAVMSVPESGRLCFRRQRSPVTKAPAILGRPG